MGAGEAAGGAEGFLVEVVAVGVEVVFGEVGIERNLEFGAENLSDMVPGGALELEELNVGGILLMP